MHQRPYLRKITGNSADLVVPASEVAGISTMHRAKGSEALPNNRKYNIYSFFPEEKRLTYWYQYRNRYVFTGAHEPKAY